LKGKNYDNNIKIQRKYNNISEVKQLIVKGYIDYCEENNIPIEKVVFALYDESQVGCYHDCDRCATPIC